MNHIVIMGRMTRDPELRHTQTGTPVASFTLAVDRGYVPRDGGERQTDFIDVVAWRNTAEFVTKYFVKGQLCAVSGRLQIRDWTDNNGNKRRSAEIVAENIYFTGDRRDRDGAPQGGGYRQNAAGSGYTPQEPYNGGGYQQPPAERSSYSQDSYGSAPSNGGFTAFDEDDGDLPF